MWACFLGGPACQPPSPSNLRQGRLVRCPPTPPNTCFFPEVDGYVAMTFLEGETRQGEVSAGTGLVCIVTLTPFSSSPSPSRSLARTNDTRDETTDWFAPRGGGRQASEAKERQRPTTPVHSICHYHPPPPPLPPPTRAEPSLERETTGERKELLPCWCSLRARWPPRLPSLFSSILSHHGPFWVFGATISLMGQSSPLRSLPSLHTAREERERGRTEQAQETSPHTSPASPSNLY